MLIAGAVAVLDAERGAPDATINSFGDALWWSLITVTTVGYGDRYPVTGAGQAIAAGLMVAGIALLGVVTAAIAAWFVRHVRRIEDELESNAVKENESILAAIHELGSRIEALENAVLSSGSHGSVIATREG
jgi:voltage-gated potassium channel